MANTTYWFPWCWLRRGISGSAAAFAIGRQTYYGMANMTPAARLEYAQGMLVTMLAAVAKPS